MEFEVAHEFTAPVERVAAALLDPAFQASLGDVGHLAGREVLSQEEEGGSVVRRTRCVLDIHLSPTVRRFIGDSDPAWVEVAKWDGGANTWSWHIEPEVAADLLQANGKTELKPSTNGTIRVITGVVRVKVPLYGGRVEAVIVDGLETSYDEEAERLAAWLS